ncbi:methyl-accepting chemotaxis protein [Clostridium senegalense]|uniref:methyl-accepting chemotaxis protein n=1 Tax=Clostridium senegalense TaxID=1465809 RepID=UPI00028828E2|nr:methyl-accepting chemotaxis protein [Clostridium senegalense]
MKKQIKNFFKPKGIGAKLLTVFLLVTFAICTSLSVISSFIAKNALNRLLNSTLPQTTEMSSKYIHEKLEISKKAVENLSANDLVIDDKLSVDEKLKTLESVLKLNGFLRIGIADKDGNIKFNDSSTNISKREYFKEALGGKVSVSAPSPSINEKDNGAIVSAYASPIKDRNGQIINVLVAIEKADFFNEIVKNIQIGETGEAFIVGNDGAIVGDKDISRIGTVNLKEACKTEESLKGFDKVLDNMIKNEKGIELYNNGSKNIFLSYNNILDTDWTLGIKIEKNEVLKDVKTIQVSSFVAALICLVIGSILIMYQIKSINKGLKNATNALNIIGNGDMTVNIDEKLIERTDELGIMGKAMKIMQGSVSSTIKSIRENAENIDNYSENLASISEEMASSTDSVANSIQEVSTGIQNQSEDVSSMVSMLEDFNHRIEKVMLSINEIGSENKEIYTLSEKSNGDMQRVTVSVSNVNDGFRSLVDKVKSVEENINKINEIITLINSISEQTNLLALNAAIEAARVGESGKGFAVVADEIRKLAEQSKISADSITKLLNTVFNETGIMVQTTEIVKGEIESQSEIINGAVGSFEKIKEAVNNITPKITDSQGLVREIVTSKESINEKVQNVMSISQEISASSQEIAAIAEEMNASSEEVASSALNLTDMTKTMKETVELFKVD